MGEMKLGVVETKFADIIWDNEPLSSRELTELAQKEIGWNRSTTYTILRRLCEKGIFRNEKGIVSSVLKREEFYALRSEQFVEDTFAGSLPAFVAAFAKRKKLSDKDIDELQSLINEMKNKNGSGSCEESTEALKPRAKKSRG